MLVANAACLLGAHEVWLRLRTGHAALDGALFLFLRFILASGAVLLAGSAGFLTATALGLAGAAALAGLLLAGAHRRIKPPPWSKIRTRLPPALLALGGLFLGRLILQAWFQAPHIGDALCYHLPKVAEWIQAGAITAETGVDYRSPFPGGFELFEIWWSVFLHHDVLIEVAGIEIWLLGLASVMALGRSAGLDVRASALGALLFAASPVVVMQAVSCLNDLAVAALLLLATALVACRAHPALILSAISAGVGVKATFGFAVPGLVALAFLVRKDPAARSAPRTAPLTLVAALAGALGAYWYFRNWALYGNPIHPGTAQGFVLPGQDRLVQQVGPSLLSLKENVRRLVDSRIFDHLLGYNPTCEMTAGWGPALFACGIPGLLVGVRDCPGLRRLALAGLVSLVSVFSLVLSDLWFTRFVLFVPALLALGAAHLSLRLKGLTILLGVSLGYQWISTLVTDRMTVGELPAMARMGWRERAPRMVGGLPEDGSPLASLDRGGLFVYLLYRPDFSRKVHYIRESEPERVVAEMRKRGVSRIYGSREANSILHECVRRKLLRPEVNPFFALPRAVP
jgi:hypothetical protein